MGKNHLPKIFVKQINHALIISTKIIPKFVTTFEIEISILRSMMQNHQALLVTNN
jgi:hypothetical protein